VATFYSCLPPEQILPPQYVSSTESSVKVKWNAPLILNGCPLISYELYRNNGNGGAVTTLVDTFEPHTNYFDITGLSQPNSPTEYILQVKAVNSAGSVVSGESYVILAATPQKPEKPVNDASVTNDQQIKVTYGTVLPDDGGSSIINIQLWMDDGQGGDLQPVTSDAE